MSSVTRRIKEVKQPYGGYVKLSQFEVFKVSDNNVLSDSENVSPAVIGMAVDYLTRFAMGSDVSKAFYISLKGAFLAEKMYNQKNAIKKANRLLNEIQFIDDKAVVCACKLVTYDSWFRNPMSAMMSNGADGVNPNMETIKNIKIMVERSVEFWKDYGPIVKDGFTFEPNGYTNVVNSGDGDYLTADTLWDFKVSKSKPNSKHILQLLMYWIMGQHSGQDIYKNIDKLGIFNPRLNTIYLLYMNNVPKEIIETIENEVICY